MMNPNERFDLDLNVAALDAAATQFHAQHVLNILGRGHQEEMEAKRKRFWKVARAVILNAINQEPPAPESFWPMTFPEAILPEQKPGLVKWVTDQLRENKLPGLQPPEPWEES